MNQIERAFADLMAAARDAAGTPSYRSTWASGAQEPVIALFADRAKVLVDRARSARGAWIGVRIEDPSPADLRKLAKARIDELTLDGWFSSYDAAVRRAARDAGLNGQIVAQLGKRMPADATHRPGRAYRIAVSDGNAR